MSDTALYSVLGIVFFGIIVTAQGFRYARGQWVAGGLVCCIFGIMLLAGL